MKSKTDFSPVQRSIDKPTEELDSLNARTRRKGEVTRFMEATIETSAKKRRSREAPASSDWKAT
jgi:hypothetical protein